MKNKLAIKWHGLVECKTAPMPDKTSMAFLNLSLMEKSGIPDGMEAEIEEKSLAYKILNQRLKVVGGSDQEITFAVKCFVTLMCDNPGKAVMWAFTLHYIRVVEKAKVDMSVLAEWFPMGFPTDQSMHEAWDAQKLATIDPEAFKNRTEMPSPDNWVDYPDNWPKIEPWTPEDQDAAARNFG